MTSIDTAVINYQNRVNMVGGSFGGRDLLSLSIFVRKLRQAGLWDLFNFLWLSPSNSNFPAASVPIKTPVSSGLWTLFNFNSGDLTVDGMIGDGSTKYANLGFATNSYILNSTSPSTHIFCCQTSGGVQIAGMGVRVSSGILMVNGNLFLETGGTRLTAASSLPGLFFGTRINGTDARIYKNKAQLASANTNGGGTITSSIELAWVNTWFGATPFSSNFSPHRHSLFATSPFGFTTTQRDTFVDLYTDYCRNIGRSTAWAT